jgi:hypothetical protein
MRKFLLITVILAGIAAAAPDAQAGIFGRWFRRAPVMRATPVVVAQPQTGYRAFTYEPAPEYAPVVTYRGNALQQRGFHNAGGKTLGTAY